MNYRDVEYLIVPYNKDMYGKVLDYQGVINDPAIGQHRVYGTTVDEADLNVRHAINVQRLKKSSSVLLAHINGNKNPNRWWFDDDVKKVDYELVFQPSGITTDAKPSAFTNPVFTSFVGRPAEVPEPDYQI